MLLHSFFKFCCISPSPGYFYVTSISLLAVPFLDDLCYWFPLYRFPLFVFILVLIVPIWWVFPPLPAILFFYTYPRGIAPCSGVCAPAVRLGRFDLSFSFFFRGVFSPRSPFQLGRCIIYKDLWGPFLVFANSPDLGRSYVIVTFSTVFFPPGSV